jgi:predicted ATPase/DNA-binding CsgD family transcriptional regulator
VRRLDGLPCEARFLHLASIPQPLTELVGRRDEVAALVELIAGAGARLVTVTGAGGSGKTRLVIEVAHELSGHFADGAAFVGLSAVEDPGLVPGEVARALGVATPSGSDVVEIVCGALSGRRMLLVLDNFEHVAPAAPFAAALSTRCPGLVLLVSSRRRLHLSGERVMPLRGLAVPDDAAAVDATAGAASAVALFCERARAVAPDLALRPERLQVIAELCRLLDGLPLAIELAAARSRMLTPEAMRERVATAKAAWRLLGHGSVDRDPDRRDLYGTIAWSCALLPPAPARVFRRLSVFGGSWSLASASAVVSEGDGGLSAEDVFEAVSDLVDLHLVDPADSDVDGDPRFVLPHTVRLFAGDRLDEEGERETVTGRHAEAYLGEARAAAAGLDGRDEGTWLERVNTNLPELRLAYGHLVAVGRYTDALAMAVALGPYWLYHARFAEGRRWLGLASSVPEAGHEALRAQATGWSARLAVDDGAGVLDDAQVRNLIDQLEDARAVLDVDEHRLAWLRACEHLSYAMRLLEGADRAWRVTDDALAHCPPGERDWWRAELLHRRALVAQQRGEPSVAAELASEAMRTADRGGNQRIAARALQAFVVNGGLGTEPADQAAALEEVLARSSAIGDVRGVASTLPLLGGTAAAAGDHAAAMDRFVQTIRLGRETGYWHGAAIGLFAVTLMAAYAGQAHDAAHLHGAVGPTLPVLQREVTARSLELYDAFMATTETALGPDRFASAVADGGRWTWTEALDAACDVGERLAGSPPARPSSAPAPAPSSQSATALLTGREREVLELMSTGLTNREIATSLFMSPKTVMHHTGRIYTKLGVRGRAEAVGLAVRQGLLGAR